MQSSKQHRSIRQAEEQEDLAVALALSASAHEQAIRDAENHAVTMTEPINHADAQAIAEALVSRAVRSRLMCGGLDSSGGTCHMVW